jgi:acetolactate synthase-1/2/3 large subunit
MATTGSEILARALKRQGTEVLFYLMGGPMLAAESACIAQGIRMVDVRHEQAAAMMAHAYSRVLNRPSVCMAASGPGVTNLVTGVANAFVDSAPVVAIGGSSPVSQLGKGAFQEMDQVAMMRPIVRWAERVYDPRRIPELVATAFRHACGGRPGPVYLDLPGDVLYRQVEDGEVAWTEPFEPRTRARPAGDPDLVRRTVDLLARAERPVLISGSGILWSDAAEELQALVDELGIPFYTTPQGRGAVAEDHALCFSHARSTAFREADVIIAVGTRLNYVIGYAQPPRFAAGAQLVQIDLDPAEIGRNRPAEIGIVGDAKAVLRQIVGAAGGRVDVKRYAEWLAHLGSVNRGKRAESEAAMRTDQVPIHPLRLCKEVRDFLDRDAILVVDGQEILNYGRQAIPTYVAGHRLNSGPFGTMGVGLPYGLGAKVAKPEAQVLVLHGDGSFGLNAMELDTAARHHLPVITVISLNGGWTADPERNKPGRDLGYTRFDRMAEALGCYGEHVEEPDGIRPALERAAEAGVPAVVNVVTDWRARATTVQFADYST